MVATALTAALAGTATPVSISGKTVVLNLATPAREGETVTLTYTIPIHQPRSRTAPATTRRA